MILGCTRNLFGPHVSPHEIFPKPRDFTGHLFVFFVFFLFVTVSFASLLTFLTENTFKLFRTLAAWPWVAVGVADLTWVSGILVWVPAGLCGCFDTHS